MRRIGCRTLLFGLILLLGGISYLVSDYTSCSGPRAEDWAKDFASRLDVSYTDYDLVSEQTTATMFSTLANKAEQRYREQLAQSPPGCLSDFQELATSFFYYQWKAYEAASVGNYEQAVAFEDKFFDELYSMQREFDELANKYDWELE